MKNVYSPNIILRHLTLENKGLIDKKVLLIIGIDPRSET